MIKNFTPIRKLLLGTLLAIAGSFSQTNAQTTIINPAGDGGFENGTTFAANGWTVVNNASATANNWVLSTGAPAGFSGTRSAYISNNSAGTPPAYAYNNGTSYTVHLYRDVTFPAGETNVSLSFSEIQDGESGWDRILVYISDAAPSGTPAAGTPSSNTTTLTGYTLLATTAQYSSWTTVNVPITAAQAGNATASSTRRLLFVWQNDGSGGSNSAAIDNISLTSICTSPMAGVVPAAIGTTTATLGWATVTGATSYNVRYKKVSDPATVATWATPTNTTGTTLPIASLTASTQYEYQVSAVGTGVCNVYSASSVFTTACAGPTITSSTGATRCGTGTVSLQAVPSTGATLSWYNTAVGGSVLSTVSPFTTPSLSATTTYYVSASSVGTSVTKTIGAGASTTSGSGGSGGNYVSPYSHYYGGYKAQYIIRASELTAAGVVAGNLTSLGFDVTATGTSYAGFAISMGMTSLTTAPASTFVASGLTPVYSGAPTPVVGINTYTFSAPFLWDGISNIIVNLCWSNNNSGGSAAEVKYDATSFVSMAYYRADGQTVSSICGATSPTSTQSNRPKMVWGNAPICEGARVPVVATVTTAPAVTASSPQAPGVCTGGSATINATSSNTNYTYSWSSGQTTASFTVSPAATTTYTVTATDAGTNCVAKDSVTINVSAVPAVPVLTPATGTICQGSSIVLTAISSATASGTFGTGSNVNSTTGYPAPYSNYYGGTKHQMLIRASELLAAGLTAGNQISSIGFRVSAVGSTFTGNLQNFQINMGGTTATTLGSGSFISAPTVVYGPVTQPVPTTGFPLTVTHTLTTPFTWNGTDNIVIQTSYSNANTGATSDNVQMLNSDPGFSSTNYYYADGTTAANVLTATTPGGSGNARPNMILGYTVKAPISWPTVTGLYRNAGLTVPITATDTAISVYASPATNTTYTARANASGCFSAVSNNAVITVNPAPSSTITYTGATTFCQGATLTLSAPAGTGLTYQWRRNGNPITGATSQTYAADTTGAYTVTVTNTSPCSATTATPVNIVVNPAPPTTITPSGTTTFCVGGSVVLSAPTPPAGTTYTYVWKDNNIAVAGQTGQTFTVNTSRNVTVTVTNTTTTCSATTPVATVVTVGPPPPAPITSAITPAVICAGQNVRLRTNNAGGLTYQWKLGGVDIPGAIDSFFNATAAGNYTVVVTAGSATCASTSSALAVTVNPLPTAAITASGAPTTFCQGGSVVLTANTGTNLSYQWQVGAAPVIPANTTSTHTAATAGSYTVIVTNTATSCFNTSNAVAVTVNPLPVATVTPAASTSICAGTSVVLNANTGTGLTYQWQNGSGVIPGATSASYSANTSGTYTVKVTNANNCTNTSTPATTVTVNPLPPTTITPVGTVNICSGSSATLNGPTGTGLTYQWRNGVANASGTSTTASYTTSAAGAYRLVVTSAAGCKDSSAVANVTVLPLPAVAVSPATATSGCDSVVMTTANTGVTYQWNYNNAPIIGATGQSYAARVTGNYSLTNTSTTNGCAATSANVPITVNQAPIAAITYTSPIIFCEGGAVVLNTYGAPNQTYEWRDSNIVIPGANTPEYITTTGGIYTVKVVNTLTGCTRISPQPVIVRVNPLPHPVITYSAASNLLTTTQPYSLYQWYRNQQPVNGATQRTHTPQENGAYAVTVTDSNGCINLSAITFVNSVGIANTTVGKAIRIYPNPTNGVLYIKSAVSVNLAVRDVTGKTVLSAPDADHLNLERLADGMYLLYITDQSGQLIRAEKITKSGN